MKQDQRQPREQALALLKLLVPDEQPTAAQILWAIRIVVAVVIVLGVLVLIGSSFGITLWDWLRVLAVPVTIGVAVPWLNWLQKERELEVEQKRAADEALQAYLDQMSQLLTDRGRPLHRAQPGDSLSTVARARTLTVLQRLDPGGKRSVLEFLYESRLLDQERAVFELESADLMWAFLPLLKLSGINLSGTVLVEADLSRVDLSRAILRDAMLNEADVSNTELNEADLSHANLSNTNLNWTFLREASLKYALLFGADLSHAWLSDADLEGAHLDNANLRGADLRGANLHNANLRGADLTEATGLTDEQIAAAEFLEGATMPNGQKYEDWIKSKGSGEDEENE